MQKPANTCDNALPHASASGGDTERCTSGSHGLCHNRVSTKGSTRCLPDTRVLHTQWETQQRRHVREQKPLGRLP